MSAITIAIDGHSSCGKSTLAKALAKHLGLRYVDSGAMYRAVALYALRNGMAEGDGIDRQRLVDALDGVSISFRLNAETGAAHACLNGEDVEDEIRSLRVSNVVSHVSAIREVRAKLRSLQQAMGREGGVVMDGRDIGTAVFPDAELKIFMTADLETRAVRRFEELRAKGRGVSLDEVRTNLADRDLEDSTRAEDPLRMADGAKVLDSSKMNQQEQLEMALGWARALMAG